ncbi:hypothetical protein Glove_40g21 [Diversispora epigaea]|uniref:Rab-GAP TBC domain-containing protein n=1 Tax=Diversispora epigaea TaxID=1348612 RepID=A0A397JHQ4_9GLOM|nr:hypothetical protein Glove_40g21 [Diversispora epigaea]
MIGEKSNPRDSYYSSLIDEYMINSTRDANPPTTAWNNTNGIRKRPSLNLHIRNSSISSLKRLPSFNSQTLKNPTNHSNQISLMFNYTTNPGCLASPPPSPRYIFSEYNSYNKSHNNNLENKDINDSLTVPQQSRKRSMESLSSGSYNQEDQYIRPSSASSYYEEDVRYTPKVNPTKRSSSRQDSNNSDKRQSDTDRDRYGFRRSYTWITHKEYSEFESSYNQVLQRRKQKWDTLLNEHGGLIPSRSAKMKRYIRKGIPPKLRGKIWFHYSGAEAKMKEFGGLYQQFILKSQDPNLENEYVEVIERDLHRTFPENIKFKSTVIMDDNNSSIISTDNVPIIQSLRRVLTAFSLYSPNIGYCQSLNYIVGILLLFMEEEKAFWTLVTIIHDYLPENMYDVTMEGSNVDQAVLMMFIMEKMPQIWNKLNGGSGWDVEKLDGNLPTITLVTSHWFLTLFINILPIETLLRVWDCFFYEGNKVLFRAALAIFKINEEKIMAVDDPMEIFQVVQNMPKRLVDCHKLIDMCFRRRRGLTDISQLEIDRRREFFRERRKKRVAKH